MLGGGCLTDFKFWELDIIRYQYTERRDSSRSRENPYTVYSLHFIQKGGIYLKQSHMGGKTVSSEV